MPGWRFDGESFRADAPGAERLLLPEKPPEFRLESLDERRGIWRTGARVFEPSRLRFDLCDVGPLLQCRKGFELRVGSTAAPFLSWTDGSVGPGVPTPDVRWAILSFRDDQPPIVIGFPERAASLRIAGEPGRWIVGTEGKDDLGWVRLALPVGNRAFATNGPGELGRLANLTAANADLWTAPPVELQAFSVVADANGVTATWRFDRAGAVVPLALDLAPGGGYGVILRSETRRTDVRLGEAAEGAEFSAVVTTEPDLVVRFPTRLLPLGRALAVGKPEGVAPPADPADVGATARYALSRLLAAGSPQEAKLDEAYYAIAPSAVEPLTGQNLLFAPDGKGLDLAAANALLARCRANAAALPASESEAAAALPEPQLVSLIWRRDWRTLGFYGVESGLARRAAALAALAGAFSPDASRRLEGALFEAGLAADRVMASRRALASGAASPKLSEPFGDLRAGVFARAFGPPYTAAGDPFWAALRSPVRVVGAARVVLGEDGTLSYDAPFRLFAEPEATLGGAPASAEIVAVPIPITAAFARPAQAPPVPPLAPVPLWSESPR